MREVIKEGRNVEEAIDLACAQLGADRGQVGFEILELPKTSLFGLRKKPAKVRVFIEEPEAPKKKPEKPALKKEQSPAEPKREPREMVRQAPPKPQPHPAEAKPKMVPPLPKQEAPKPQAVPAAAIHPAGAAVPAPVPAAAVPAPPPLPAQPEGKPSAKQPIPAELKHEHSPEGQNTSDFLPMEQTEGKIQIACAYVKTVLLEMGIDAKITAAQTENGLVIRLAGEGLGVVIGRRGETLDALQYLTGLVTNRYEGDYLRVTIDTGNYREKRERTLQQLARKISISALRTGRSSMLEPMNPYERRIIHAAVSQIDGVTSSSIGEEPNRRVVISPVNAKPRPSRRNGPSHGRGGNGKRRYGENTGEFRERAPRRESRAEASGEGSPSEKSKDTACPTSVEVDREYAKVLERDAAFAKPEQSSRPAVRERAAREKPRDEAHDLPLYGKIEL